MDPLVLYHFPRSSCSRKVVFALSAKALSYDEVIIDLPGNQHRSPEFLRLNPKGEVPVLRVGEQFLHDSAVINEFIEEAQPTPPLLPADPVWRARCRLYALFGDRDFYPQVARVLQEKRKPADLRDEQVVARAVAAIERETLPWLEGILAKGGPFLCGDAVTLADIAFAPALDNLISVGGLSLKAFPACAAWFRLIEEEESFKATRRFHPSYASGNRREVMVAGEGSWLRHP